MAKAALGTVEGRIDPIVATLTPGNSYAFQIELEDYYWKKEAKFVDLSLTSGRYTIHAAYIGGVNNTYIDQTGNVHPSLPFWTGIITSNMLPFTIPAP